MAHLSDKPVMVRELLPLAAGLLFALVCNVLIFLLMILVMFSGPIIYVVAWNAMESRLDCERPAPHGWQESWNTRWPTMLQIYVRTYGLDNNLMLALAGLVATILTFYFSSPILAIFANLTHALGVNV